MKKLKLVAVAIGEWLKSQLVIWVLLSVTCIVSQLMVESKRISQADSNLIAAFFMLAYIFNLVIAIVLFVGKKLLRLILRIKGSSNVERSRDLQ